jgi:CoA:oxalate CoA-transferase
MLDGIKVLDLTMHLSGPYCCWLLGSLGAEVIKVERPDGGDPVREIGPFVHGQSTYFGSVNRNKRGIVLDLKSSEGKHALAKLIEKSDVLVENFRAGVLAKLGFDEARLKALNPDLIYASITGFGQKGAMKKRPAFDIVIQGMGGLMSMTGATDGPPTAVGVSIADLTTGIFAALDVVAGLLQRQRTGHARRIDVSMLDCQVALLENAVARHLNAAEMPARVGSRHPKITPFQLYRTLDGTIVIAADGEPNWRRMCAAMNLDSLADDPRFGDNASRVLHYDELEGALNEVFLTKTSDEWIDLLVAADVPCGPVNTVQGVLAMEQIRHRQMISRVQLDGGETLQFSASPIGARGARPELPAPALGQHTDEVLAEIGISRTLLSAI